MFVFVKSVVLYKGWNKDKKGGFQTPLHTMQRFKGFFIRLVGSAMFGTTLKLVTLVRLP